MHYLRDGPGDGPGDGTDGGTGGAPDADPGDGRAPTLVFLHGAGTSLLDAVPTLLPRLAERFDVVAIDRPGHGYSDRGSPAPDTGWVDPAAQARRAAGALEALGIERAVWIGHSWAGAVVLAALATLDPGDASAGVAIAGALYPWPDPPSPIHALGATPVAGAAFAHAFVAPVGRARLDGAVARAFAPEPVPPGLAAATGLALSLRPGAFRHDAVDRTRLSGWLEGAAPGWAAVDRPLLSIAAARDRVVPPARHAARLERERPATRTVVLPGAGHGLIHTRADRVAREIGAFVDGLGERSAPGD